MAKKNIASVNIGGSVSNNSKARGGKIHTVQGKELTEENDVSVTIGKDVTNSSEVEAGEIYEYPNIAELKAEIQELLNELAENPRTAKEAVAIEIIKEEINEKPTLRQRLYSALKAGGIEALKAIFNHPAVSIPVETVKGFLEAG